MTRYKVFGSRNILLDLTSIMHRLCAHTKAAALFIGDIGPLHIESSNFVGLSDSLGSDNDLATVLLPIMRKVFNIHLLLGAHKFSHRRLHFSNHVIALTTISVDYHKFKILHLLKEVLHCKSSLKVRIQRVLDLLSLPKLNPSVLLSLIKDAAWI